MILQKLRYALGLSLGLVLPLSTWALTAEVLSIYPAPEEDISSMMDDTPELVEASGWIVDGLHIDNAVEYTTVFTVDEEPAGVITPGAILSIDTPSVWDETAGTYTVHFVPTGMEQPTDSESPENVVIVALVGVADTGEDGPPEEMKGFWLSTNVQDWALIPPSPAQETPAFGYSLTGPVGETGTMFNFMPTGIKDLLSEYAGEELEWSDMAIFDGDNQASLGITEVAGGALFELSVIFSETAVVTPSGKSTTVTKTLTVQERLPISLAANKTELNKGKQFRLYGWLKNGKAKQTVTVWRKLTGENNYTKVDTLTSKADGYFKETYTARKTASYKVKYRKNGKTITSDATTVTVN